MDDEDVIKIRKVCSRWAVFDRGGNMRSKNQNQIKIKTKLKIIVVQ